MPGILSSIKSDIAVGLLIIAGVGLLVYSSVRITGWNSDTASAYTVEVFLDNITGLAAGSAVRMAGIKIGEISEITLEEGKAKLTLRIFEKYKLRADSVVSIKSLGILGDKYISISPGSPGFDYLENADRLTLVETGTDLDSLIDNLSGTLNDIKSVTWALNQSFGGERGAGKFDRILENIENLTFSLREITGKTNDRIDGILVNIDGFSANLNNITGENREDIRQIMTAIREVSTELRAVMTENRKNILTITENLAAFSDDLNEKSPEITDSLRASLKDLESASQKIDDSFKNIASITDKINSGDGTVAQLINEKQTVVKLNKALDDLGGFLGSANKLKFDIDFHSEYFNVYEDYKSNLGINIYPNRYHSFSIQLVDDPRGKTVTKTERITETDAQGNETTREETTETTTQDYKLSLLIAQRYFDTTFRAGLMESKFGVGLEQFFGRNDDFSTYLNAYDFSRQAGVHYKVGGKWRFHANLYLTFGADDFANESDSDRNFFLGFGLGFNEDNLKFLAASSGALGSFQ